jgi:hypothetical protein
MASASQQLLKDEKRALKAVAFALDKFEPFTLRLIPENVLHRLVAKDLAERGPSFRPSVAPVGYRLSAAGWELVRKIWTQ